MAYANTTRAVRKGLVDRLLAMKEDFSETLRRRKLFEKTVRELESLTDRELTDLGISRLSIRDVAREAAYGK